MGASTGSSKPPAVGLSRGSVLPGFADRTLGSPRQRSATLPIPCAEDFFEMSPNFSLWGFSESVDSGMANNRLFLLILEFWDGLGGNIYNLALDSLEEVKFKGQNARTYYFQYSPFEGNSH